MNVDGRVALITGGKRIGSVVATELARAGADVALVYSHSQAEAEETARAVGGDGQRATVIQANLAIRMPVERVVDGTVDGLGRLDVLVNMASVYRAMPFDELTVEDWDAHSKSIFERRWLCTRAAVPHMRRLRGGRISTSLTGSLGAGDHGTRGHLTYYVAKAGIAALTEGLLSNWPTIRSL